MAAVRAEDVVVGREREGHADGRGFLPDGKMGRAEMIVLDALVNALDLDLVEDGFELADGGHVLPDGEEVLL